MSVVWILAYEDTDDPSNNSITIWESELAARRQACSDLLTNISHNWDLNDSDIKAIAESVNNYVMAGDFKAAMKEYNDYEAEQDYGYFVHTRTADLSTLQDADQPAILVFPDPDEDEDSEEEEDEEQEETYQATDPGATCRGPCGQTNEYAYANKRDGTYVCHSCRMMSQVFGGKIT